MNKIELLGRISNDLEIKEYNETKVLKFNIAVNRMKKKNQDKPEVDFINCTSFGNQAEVIQKYFNKGDFICVTGRLQIENYEKDGIKKQSHSVILESFDFCGNAKKEGTNEPTTDENGTPDFSNIPDDDLPF